MPKNLIPKITLSADETKRLQDRLEEMLSAAEEYRSEKNWDSLHEQYWKQYLAEPDSLTKDFPWENSPLSDDTEVLTKSGWKLVSALDIEDLVYSQDPDTRDATWKPVQATQKFHYKYMIRFAGKSVDQIVSPDHKMYVIDTFSDKPKFTAAVNLVKHGHNDYKIPLTSKWSGGTEVDELWGYDAGDICEFVGWYIAEGWTYNSGTIGIAQSESANSDNCRHLEYLFDSLGMSWSRTRDKKQYLVRSKNIPEDLRDCLKKLGTAQFKYIPECIKNLGTGSLRRLFLGMMLGDGCDFFREDRNYPKSSYFTISKRLADDVQEIVQKLGARARIIKRKPGCGGVIQERAIKSIQEGYVININYKDRAKVGALKRELVPYDKYAYCVTTPWHTIYIRRNGIASWTGNSNLFLPMTQVACDAIRAQEFDAMLSNDPKVVGMEFSDYQFAEDLSSYYFDYYFKDVSPIVTWGTDLLLDTIVDGTGCVKIRQNQDYFVRRSDRIEDRVKTRARDYEDPITGEKIRVDEPYVESRRVEEARIEQVDQTEVENVDIGSIYVAPDTGASLEWPVCRWYYQRQYLTWDDLLERRRHGYDIPDEIKNFLEDRLLSDKEQAIREREEISGTSVESTVSVCEFYMRWPLPTRYMKETREEPEGEEIEQEEGDEDGIPEEIVVTYCPSAKRIMLVRPLSRVTPDGRRPHVATHYQRIPRFFYGLGVPAKLRHLNAVLNSQWNQRMDWGTLAVLPWGFYSPGLTDLLPDIGAIKPGQLIPTMDPRGVVFPRLQGDPNFWISADQQIQSWAEKVSNISDYNLGRAPQTPNAPRTRGGQAMMLQQSNIGFSLLVSIHAQAFLDIFRRVHAFHKRYAKPGDIYRVLNKETNALQQKSIRAGMFDRDVDFQFVLNPNRYLQQQQKQVLFGMTMQAMMQAMQVPPLSQSIRTALADLYASFQMKNFDSIWPPELMPTIQMQQQQQMMMQQGMPPGGAPGGPPGQGMQASPEMMAQAQAAAAPLEDRFGYETAPETALEEEKIDVG